MEELFNRSVPLLIRKSEKDEKSATVCLCVILNTVTSPAHKKELLIQLTDEDDPFFLFTVSVGEDDFQRLKTQQGLRPDFTTFPQEFIDLVERCLSEAEKPSPEWLLQLSLSGEKGTALLSVVQIGRVRHLVHLSLKLVPASDTCLKKYLAECLLRLKDEKSQLSQSLVATRTELECTHQSLTNKTRELEKLKSDWSVHSTSLINEHSAKLNAEKERAMLALSESQQKFDKERKDFEISHGNKVSSLEQRMRELDTANQELTDHKYRSEAAIRELKAKLKGAKEELSHVKKELMQSHHMSSLLDSSSKELENIVDQMKRELRDKEEVIDTISKQLSATKEEKHSLESVLEQRMRQITKLDTAFRQSSQEVQKGNGIIKKLAGEVKCLRDKLKARNSVVTQQEERIKERELEVQRQVGELDSLHRTVRQREEEMGMMKERLEEVKSKLQDSQETVQKNERMIEWLNKQVNEHMMTRSLPTELPSSIRPSPTGLPVNRSAGLAGYGPQFSSTPTVYTVGTGRHVMGSLSNQENIQQKVLFKGPAGGRLGHVYDPSPIATHFLSATPQSHSSGQQTEASALTAQHPTGAAIRTSPTGSSLQHEPTLDPKYLPPLKTVTTTTSVGVSAPGVRVKGEGHKGGVSPLVAAYLTDNQ